MTATLRGLTWDHPRGYLVLDALAAAAAGYSVRWERQPLEDFESRPLRTLADDYDLLVIDHPGLGEAVRDGSLQPLSRFFGPAELARWRGARAALGTTAAVAEATTKGGSLVPLAPALLALVVLLVLAESMLSDHTLQRPSQRSSKLEAS